MTGAEIPEDGELSVGPVRLPAGRRVRAGQGSGGPVAWATVREVPGAGRVWAALSAAHAESGLVPFLLSGFDLSDAERPWDSGEFDDPADIGGLEDLDAGALLGQWWDDKTIELDIDEDEDDDGFARELAESLAPFSRQFPGLAPAEETEIGAGSAGEVLAAMPPARIGLVPAARPADALPLLGWTGAGQDMALPVAAVLRSWEDRFGARLLRVGFAEITVLARRPPRSLTSAQLLAAEQWAFCSECAGQGLHDIPRITASLTSSPVWTCWWD